MGGQIATISSRIKNLSLFKGRTDETHRLQAIPEEEETASMNLSLLNNPRGLNYKQITSFKKILSFQPIESFSHAGGKQDKIPHDIVSVLTPNLHIYPSGDTEFREGVIHEATTVADRNRKLVDVSDVIIAVPLLVFEYEDSPTWKTINYAVSKGKEVYVLSQKGIIYKVIQ